MSCSRHLFFDRAGEAITQQRWSELCIDDAVRIVGNEVVPSLLSYAFVEVSTVWTGLRSVPFDPPLIFETMIFGGMFDHQQWRYADERSALDGHARLVAAVRASESPP